MPALALGLAVGATAGALVAVVGFRLAESLVQDRRRRLAPLPVLGMVGTALVVGSFSVDLGGLTGSPIADRLAAATWTGLLAISGLILSRSAARFGRSMLITGAVLVAVGVHQSHPGAAALGAVAAGASGALWAHGEPRPALAIRGAAGILLGAAMAVASAGAVPAGSPGWRLGAMSIPLAVVLGDGVSTAWDRLRSGRSIVDASPDTVADRLRTAGLSRRASRRAVEAGHLACSGAAVLFGIGDLSLVAAALVASLAVLALLAVAQSARQGSSSVRRGPIVVVVGVLALAGAASATSALAVLTARSSVLAGASQAQAALQDARGGNIDAARLNFAAAESSFADAAADLDRPLATIGLPVPIVGANLAVARRLVADGRQLSLLGATLAETEDAESLRVVGGRVPVDDVRSVAKDLELASETLGGTVAHTNDARRRDLLGPLREALDRFTPRLTLAHRDARRASDAARILPGAVGGDGPKRYFLAVQNNAESRATGGFIGNFGEVTAVDGKLELGRFGRISELNADDPRIPRELHGPADYIDRYARFKPERTWQNVNLSPDLGAVAEVVSDLYPQSGGARVDGLLAIDPVGLAALLALTGPVDVAPWPEPITAANVVDVTLKQAYVTFPEQEARVQFLSDVSDAVIRRVTTGALGRPSEIVKGLADAVAGGHLRFTSLDRPTDDVLGELGISGRIAPSPGDSVMVTSQNAAANKLDVYLHRRLSYDVGLTPSADGRATATAHFAAELANDLPATPLPPSVVGPFLPQFQAGQSRSFVSVYSPLRLLHARLDGAPVGVESQKELGRRVYSTFVDVLANQHRTFELDLEGELRLADDGWYDLELLRQPLLLPDQAEVTVRVSEGYRIRDAVGLRRTGPRTASVSLDLDRNRRMRVRIERAG